MGPEIQLLSTGRPQRIATRMTEFAQARVSRARELWQRTFPPPGPSHPGQGPSFPFVTNTPTLDELRGVLEHPQVLASIERDLPPFFPREPPPARHPMGGERICATPRRRLVRIYDVFPFALELDLLELRLAQLGDLVDRFIVVESPVGFGGVPKPLFLGRNLDRFRHFRDKLVPVVLDDDAVGVPRGDRRLGTDLRQEAALRNATWRAARSHIDPGPDTVVLWSDVDELPSRSVLRWIRDFDVPLPLRFHAPTLRYSFGWRDPETFAEVVAFSPQALPDVEGHRLRHLDAPLLAARGTVHLTSFLHPLALAAKFAMTTEWEPGIHAYVRNEYDETAHMVESGRWFGRPMRRYDGERDPLGLVPWAARAHRERFAPLWGPAR